MKRVRLLALAAATCLLAACASSPAPSSDAAEQSSTSSTPGADVVKSRDGSFEGEVYGKAAPGSGFSRLQIGMSDSEVQDVLDRAPDRWHTYESGKRWIPFYFGNDARRMQVLYKGEGCLIFTGGNIWGGGGSDLITIENDPSGACYQP